MDQLRLGAVLAGLGPVLLVQGKAVRRSTPLLPICPDQSVPGAGMRVGFVGDSIIAGVGVDSQHEGLAGRLAFHLSRLSGRPVEWRTFGFNGARARDLARVPLPQDLTPDILVVSVGVNDALNLTPRNTFRRHLGALAGRFPDSARILAGIPDFSDFPTLPRPLRDVLAWRSRALCAAVPLPWQLFRFNRPLARDEFSADGFHPGARGCEAWARDLAPFVLSAAESALRR